MSSVDDGPGPSQPEVDEPTAPRVVSLGRVVTVVVVAAFLGGAIGYLLGTGRPPDDQSVDVGFYRDMTVHHDQGVLLALIELRNGSEPVVRGFAEEIVLGQRWELGRMYEQLIEWGAPVGPSETVMGWMGMPTAVDQMPGLATEEQLAALRAASGRDADALFLELMAEHHRGAVHMAGYAAEHAADPDVRALAAVMARNQAVEIDEFRQTADRLGLDVEIAPVTAPGPHTGDH